MFKLNVIANHFFLWLPFKLFAATTWAEVQPPEHHSPSSRELSRDRQTEHTHFIGFPAWETATGLSATTYTILCIFLSGYQGKINWDRAICVRKLTVFKKNPTINLQSLDLLGDVATAEQHKKIRPLVS